MYLKSGVIHKNVQTKNKLTKQIIAKYFSVNLISEDDVYTKIIILTNKIFIYRRSPSFLDANDPKLLKALFVFW